MRKIFGLIMTVFSITALLNAQTGWKLDKAHSNITFSIKHMVVSSVTGNFKEYDITFKSDKEDFTDATVDAVVKVASINTENVQRDTHLKSDDFFNAEKYPEIKFSSKSFQKVGEGKYKITGDLTIRDVTKQVTFDATFNGSIKAPWGATIYSWTATLTLDRFDYNLKWNKAIETGGLIAGKDVTVTMNLEFDK